MFHIKSTMGDDSRTVCSTWHEPSASKRSTFRKVPVAGYLPCSVHGIRQWHILPPFYCGTFETPQESVGSATWPSRALLSSLACMTRLSTTKQRRELVPCTFFLYFLTFQREVTQHAIVQVQLAQCALLGYWVPGLHEATLPKPLTSAN
jgi:hypothetical protein